VLSLFKRNGIDTSGRASTPAVSLLISAYNEQSVIEAKILNSLGLNYPEGLLEIVVVSDGSDDETNNIVNQYSQKGVLLRYYEGRIGKTACLNKAILSATGDILVFSDANSMYDKDAVRELVKDFADETVGAVTGTTKYVSSPAERTGASAGIYSRLETLTKELESNVGSCVGADGAIFAIRKSLYRPLNEYDINDFVIPLTVVRQGFRVLLQPTAFCIEQRQQETTVEFSRQVRITNRTLRAIFNYIDMHNPMKFGIFSLQLFSHKTCKFLVPFSLMAIFVTSVALSDAGSFYFLVLFLQITSYVLAALAHFKTSVKGLSGLISICHTFAMVNMAILLGWIHYFKGRTYTTWPSYR